jgi:hypothetical protein
MRIIHDTNGFLEYIWWLSPLVNTIALQLRNVTKLISFWEAGFGSLALVQAIESLHNLKNHERLLQKAGLQEDDFHPS